MQVKKEKKVVESGEKLNCSWISVKESYLKLDDWDLTIIVSSETDDIENDPRVGHMSVAFTFLSEELLPGSRGGQGRGQLLWLLAGGSITKKRKLHVQVQSRCSAVQCNPAPTPLCLFFCTVDIVHINVWRGIARVCSGLILIKSLNLLNLLPLDQLILFCLGLTLV